MPATMAGSLRRCGEAGRRAPSESCTELIAWGGRGRPKSFCTSECRIAYDTRRAELLAQIELLENVAYRVPSETTRVVLSDLARRRWELLRYPVLDAPRS